MLFGKVVVKKNILKLQGVLKSEVLVAPPLKFDHVRMGKVQLEVTENSVHA